MPQASAWDIRLLGPVVASRDGRTLDLGGHKQLALFAVLALHNGKAVSVDRLVDDVWGNVPPPGAAKTLQVYVSRLRGALGANLILRDGSGYRLDLNPEAVDVHRFERMCTEGRELCSNGNAAAASKTLQTGLDLWRGTPLSQLSSDSFAGAEVARLQELRLGALEDRIDADLELGRHAALVTELEQLTREHPRRERLRAQLMLALYRGGRQADALHVYREGRQILHDELGLEPGPELQELERAILNQEPELRAPERVVWRQTADRRRGALLAVVGGLLLAVAALAALTVVRASTGTSGLAAAPSDTLVEIDSASNALVAELPIGSAPVAVTVGAGSVWVANAGDQTLTRVDPMSQQILGRTGLGRIPSEIAFGSGTLWVASAVGVRGVVQGIDPGTASVVQTRTIRVGAGQGGDVFAPPTPSALASGARRVWVNNLHSKLSRFVPDRPGIVSQALGPPHSVDGIAVGEDAVWVTSGADDRVLRLDPRGVLVAQIPIAAAPDARVASPYGIAVGDGSVWVTNALSNTVSEIDPKLNAVTATIRVGTRPTRIAVATHAVWVVNAGDGTVTRIDPRRHVAVATIEVGRAVTGIAVGFGRVWATVAGGAPTQTTTHAPARLATFPRSSCTPAVQGTGTPDLLIASELPTFGGERAPDPIVADMHAAILDIFRRHGFRAGRYRLAYQACDDSVAGEGSTPERCAANARAFSLNSSLAGVIGTYKSSCAQIELPILNAATAGPVPMLSPTNTYVGLTHPGPATAADEPDRYRPTGSRSYFRLLGSDDDQSAAIAMFLRQRGSERVYLLDDGEGTGFAGATYVARAARRLGLPIVGRDTWDVGALDYRRLARLVEHAKPDAVVLSGYANGLQLVTDLRAVLGPGPVLIGTDNFTGTGDEFRTAPGRLGFRTSVAGRPLELLPGSGRQLLGEVAGSRATDDVDPTVAYAAEAANLLIDAIARSDGTRISVIRALQAIRLSHSLIGPIAFDPEGDPVPAPVTIYRVDPTIPHRNHRGVQGLVPEQTYTPPEGLAR